MELLEIKPVNDFMEKMTLDAVKELKESVVESVFTSQASNQIFNSAKKFVNAELNNLKLSQDGILKIGDEIHLYNDGELDAVAVKHGDKYVIKTTIIEYTLDELLDEFTTRYQILKTGILLKLRIDYIGDS